MAKFYRSEDRTVLYDQSGDRAITADGILCQRGKRTGCG